MGFPLKTKRDSWTEDQILALPLGEPDAFDRKSGRLLSKPNFEEDLGKALSAFANTGGGHLLLGVQDDGTFDGVPAMTKKGKTTTREWLEQKIPALLDRPLQDFKVHEVVPSSPSSIPAGKVVIVIDVGDSNLAPHQNVSNHIYYFRVGGHSKPAPHFYLDILWNRLTFPTGSVVRAWFDTVINPLINALKNERRTARKQKWVWDRFTQTIDGMRLLSSFSENLEQFVLSHSDVRHLLRQHDNAVLHLISSVGARAILESTQR
jgi:predicted HTH transcriptional regulator